MFSVYSVSIPHSPSKWSIRQPQSIASILTPPHPFEPSHLSSVVNVEGFVFIGQCMFPCFVSLYTTRMRSFGFLFFSINFFHFVWQYFRNLLPFLTTLGIFYIFISDFLVNAWWYLTVVLTYISFDMALFKLKAFHKTYWKQTCFHFQGIVLAS